VRALLRARLAASSPDGGLPWAAWMTQGMVAGVLCGLMRGELPPFAYALVSCTITAALVAIPLLGELGYLLRDDPAGRWVAALPISSRERRIARTLHLLIALGMLALGGLGPATLLAPASFGILGRLGLFACGLACVLSLSAVLLLAQGLLGGRLEGLLVALQTALVIGVVSGFAAGLALVPQLAQATGFDALEGVLRLWPGAWFAAPWATPDSLLGALLPLGLSALALFVLAFAPTPRAAPPSTRPSALEWLLLPARRLAQRLWLTPEERGPFALVYDALPREREVILRSVPLVGVPLAFVLASALGEAGPRQDGLLAVLLFTPATYLPVLLTQVPISASHRARWIMETAPISRAAVMSGAIKALALRFLLPLYLVLGGLAAWRGGVEFAARLVPVGALVSLLSLRLTYPRCVNEPPLSMPPDQSRGHEGQGDIFFALAFFLTVLAVLAVGLLTTPLRAAVAFALLAALETRSARRMRSLPDPALAPSSAG